MKSSRIPVLALVVLAGSAVSGASAWAATPGSDAARTEAARLEANKQLLLHDFALAGDLEARKRLRTDDYIQHNPRFVALTGVHGPEAWASAIQAGRGKAPLTDTDFSFRSTPVLVMAEGDLVTAIYKAVLPDPDHPGQVYEAFTFETVRIRDGKLAEHWDAAKLAPGWRVPIDGAAPGAAQPLSAPGAAAPVPR
jgi:predicted SnoaL-like aldol condensation-catalyzing enzyme